MRMSCNGCRVLRKGCSENCSIRPCLEWIKNPESQANATVFLAKFYGRAGLTSLINAGAEHERPAIFRSLLYEACGRMVNPVFGAVGLLWSGNWQICHAAVESILKGCPISPADGFISGGPEFSAQQSNKKSNPSPLMQSIANELHKVKTKGRFKQSKKSSELSKDISQIILEAEASEVCNLRWGRSYTGEEDTSHYLVSSDSSSESEQQCFEPRNNDAGFEPSSGKADLNASKAMDSSTQHEIAQTECESEIELELTLCCQSPGSKQSNNSAENSIPVITSLGLGLIPTMKKQQDQVKGFVSPAEVDQWLESNPMYCPGALHFQQKNLTVISYGIQTNSTGKRKRGYYEESTLKFQIPLQVAAEREIARYLTGDSSFSWNVGLKEFAHPATESFSTVGSIGPTFFLAAAMFGFVIQLGSILAEKELKLRQAMSIMGLYDSVYWLTWLTWEGLLTLVSAILLILFGMIFQFDFFLNNSFEILFLTFFLFQFNMVGFAFMLSTFISKSSSATSVGFSVYIIGFITQLVTTFGFPYSDTYSKNLRTIWSIFPPNVFSKGLNLLGDATSTKQDEGISWSSRSKCPSVDSDCLITMDDIFKWLTATFFVWFILAIYFDNVLPDVNGVRKSWFYLLNPSYWTGKTSNQIEGGGCSSCTGSIPPLSESSPDDEDVAEEESLVKHQATENRIDPSVAVQVRGLVKTFPGIRNMVGCCKCKKTAPYHAVKGLWVNFEKGKLFCLLGPNGAGKTTTINCLTGITPITAGDALTYGHSIKTTSGMSHIRNLMGVCPQFDILWDALSAQEHLYLFASIKGMPKSAIKSDAENLLSKVKLSDAAGLRAGSYSGGMKRRLSVAIALIGDPKLVFLDEPTTGMDPVTRRHVWDIIEDAKKGRAIVLTTHSMEEADILSDRIAIMAKGKLRCIGTSIRLKSRFGAGYVVHVSMYKESKNNLQKGNNSMQRVGSGPQYEKVKHLFRERLNLEPKEENKSYIMFIIPREKEEQLTEFFEELENRVKELGISDIQLSLATLEEVFLNIAMQAEIETAAAERRFATLNLLSGSSIQVPIGARFVVIPGTETPENPGGLMVEAYWQQDDTGTLCISGQSDEMPVPQHLANTENLTSSLRNRSRRSFGSLSSGNPTPIGLVIDADISSASNRSH